MKYKKIIILPLVACFLCSCTAKEPEHIIIEPVKTQREEVAADNISTMLRDNTPVCLIPTAPGTIVVDNSLASVDVSNASEGYIMAKYTGTNNKVKLQIIGPDSVCYTYNLKSGDYEAFPLSALSGDYKITIYENIIESKYSSVLAASFTVNLSNIFGPNLYPNQYCNFNKDSDVVKKAYELSTNCVSDLEVVTQVYDYVTANIVYDHEKAANVESGYLSNVDEILNSNTGICLDYAAVMTSMLRSQKIPTRLEVGYAGSAYHAWISTYIEDIGWVNGIIEFDGESWSLMDPTFAASSDEQTFRNFIGNGSNYKTKYIY